VTDKATLAASLRRQAKDIREHVEQMLGDVTERHSILEDMASDAHDLEQAATLLDAQSAAPEPLGDATLKDIMLEERKKAGLLIFDGRYCREIAGSMMPVEAWTVERYILAAMRRVASARPAEPNSASADGGKQPFTEGAGTSEGVSIPALAGPSIPIPEPTCPTIDKIIELLEQLRHDNANLRFGVMHYEALSKEIASGVDRDEVLEEAAQLVDAEYSRVRALERPTDDPLSMDAGVNQQLRMAAVMLPDVANKIRRLKSAAPPADHNGERHD